ncbi:putative leucine-rich repeat-containing protein DDB_G0290503 isoform X3 [Pecten maximus]|uniref:putative leucine-rich repeat-containing protein DDB_G0290503 isoform X3 n=1 Tax=Pecten maximus TaxID=6579 RepID=UPI0014581503|nr:putative leucine-rich repeat-containing protein DDB_G0290503 isoform X3 [Pecten maximus]
MENTLFWRKLHDAPRYLKNPSPQSKMAVPANRVRPPAQLQSRYSQLPNINTPRDGQLVPVQGRKTSPGYINSLDAEGDERLRQVEVRLSVAEKSNRALLEEVLRLQGDIKSSSRRNEDILRDERSSRQNLESAIKISNELISQLGTRIKEAEEKLHDEKSALSSLVNHTKGVEQAVKSSQNELLTKRDLQSSKISEMRVDLDEVLQAKSQLERVAFQLADDIRGLKMKVDSQASDFTAVSGDLKNKSKKLEDENRAQEEKLDALRKHTSLQSQSEQQATLLRGQVETRLTELRDVLVDVRSKQENEVVERRSLEQSMQQKVNELQQSLSEANRKREETVHSMDMVLREREHATQADRLTLTTKVADTVEDLNKKLMEKDIKIRGEVQDRYLQLERVLQQDQTTRREYERATHDELEKRLAALKKVQDEQSVEIKELMKTEKGKTKTTLGKLDDSITILEKQVLETKKSFEKVMAAEISQRKIHERDTAEKIGSVNEKLQIATSTLQQSIGGITHTTSNQHDKLRREMRTLLAEQKEASTRSLTDLDARMNFTKNRMNDLEEKLEAKVASYIVKYKNEEASQNLAESLREKVDTISSWQDQTSQTVKELSLGVQRLPEEIYSIQEKQTLIKSEMNSRMTAEADSRIREIENLKQEVQMLKMKREPKAATISDIENVQASVRRLADSIQTVKTVLGMKIQSEQKLRIEGLEDLQTQVQQIKVSAGMPSYRGHPEYLQGDMGYSWDDQDNQYGYGNRGKVGYQEDPGSQYGYASRGKGGYHQDEETHRTDRTDMKTRGGTRDFDTGYGTATDTGYGTATGTGYGTATDTQMGMIPEDKESYNKSPVPSTGSAELNNGNATPKQSRTPRGGVTPNPPSVRDPPSVRNTPTRSRNNTPGGTKSKTPTQSRTNTPGGTSVKAKANSKSRRNSQDSAVTEAGPGAGLAEV